MLPAEEWKSIEAGEAKYGELCRTAGQRNQLPDGWCQAMIKRESNFDERAFRQERNSDGTPRVVNGRLLTGIGLMQITDPGLKGRYTDEELYAPSLNIEVGCRYLGYLASRADVRGPDGKADFARLSAAFNHGHVEDTSANRWGMVSTGNHVDYEVRALNTWTYLKLEGEKMWAAQALAKNFSTPELLGDDFDKPAGLSDDVPPTPRNT